MNGGVSTAPDLGCTVVAQTAAPDRPQQAPDGIEGGEGGCDQEMPKALGISCHHQSAEREGLKNLDFFIAITPLAKHLSACQMNEMAPSKTWAI
jgi:hypothetical protein